MNKIYFWSIAGGAFLVFTAAMTGYVFVEKHTVSAEREVDESAIDSTSRPIPTRSASRVQSTEPVLVKTITINAKYPKTIEESNDRTGTYLGQSQLLSNGDFAYIINHGLSPSLFLNEEKIADNVFLLQEIGGKLMYISNDASITTHSLFYGTDLLATAPVVSLTDTFDVTEIDGKLAYTVADKVLNKKSLFYDGKKIAEAQNIQNIQKTSGGISYVAHDYSSDTDTLFYNGKAYATAQEIPDYVEDDGNRIAYTTFTFTDKVPKKGGGYLSSDYPTVETLFYDGKQIVSADSVKIKKISGKLAYITKPVNSEKYELYYESKLLQSADSIDDLSLREIMGEPAYVAKDYNTREQKLFIGDRLVAKTKIDNSLQFEEIAGKLAYSLFDSSTRENSTFYSEQKLPRDTSFYSLQEVNGKLAYIVVDQSQRGNLYYDNQKIGGDYDIKNVIAFKSDPGILYFTTAIETESSILISIYKVNCQ